LSSLLDVDILLPQDHDFVATLGVVRLAMNGLTQGSYKYKNYNFHSFKVAML
jgi:hypothetical protein